MTFLSIKWLKLMGMKKMENLKDSPIPGSFIDLFCGCGGFTLGMLRAGFKCLAAVDFEPQAVDTLRANIPEISHVLLRDLTVFEPENLAVIIGTTQVDVVVGGPPCQGFSAARESKHDN